MRNPFKDKKKTFVELAFVELVPPDISIRSTRKQLMFSTDTMKSFNMGYWQWKHGYRKRYSKKFLAKHGFEAETEGSSSSYNSAELITYMQGVDPDFKAMISASNTTASPENQMRFYLQTSGSSWSNRDSLLDGNRHLEYVTYLENGDPWEPNHHQTIVGRFKNVSTGEMTTVQVANLYGANTTFIAQYTRTSVGDDTEWFLYMTYASNVPIGVAETGAMTMTPIIPIKEQGVLIPETKSMKRMLRKLNVDADAFEESMTNQDDDGEAEIDNAYLMTGLSTINPYELLVKAYSPSDAEELPYRVIQKIKRNNDQLDPDSSYDVTEEIAHWWYYETLREQAYLARALFRTFAYYAGEISIECEEKKNPGPWYMGNCVNDFSSTVGVGRPEEETFHSVLTPTSFFGGFEVGKGHMLMRYNYNVKVTTFSGRVRPEIKDKKSQSSFHYSGTLVSKKDEDGEREYQDTVDNTGKNMLKIQVQVDENTYQEMEITGYSCGYIINGIQGEATKLVDVGLGHPKSEHRLIIPYFVLYGTRFTEFVTVYEHSFVLLAYAQKVVTISWWKKFIGIFITIVICIATYGTGCGVAVMIGQIIVGVIVGMLISKIIEMIDSEILKFVVQIIGWAIQLMMGGLDFSAITSEVWLKMAVQVGTMAIKAFEANQIKVEAESEKAEAAKERVEEKMEYGDSAMSLSASTIMSAHHSFLDQTSSDGFINDALGANLYNYDQYYDTDGEIELRKQVKSG